MVSFTAMVPESVNANCRRLRILSGVQASGRLHVGNYYGAVHQFIQLQNQSEALYFIANLHALSTVRDAHTLREHTLEAALAYLSLGLDPSKAILFRQSDIPEITELFWILGSLVPIANLERAHSYKDKIARGVSANFGLFAYPVLIAADILAFGADIVPVGKDQTQHIEFARDWATRFNMTFVEGYDPQDPQAKEQGHAPGTLKLPTAHVPERAAVVPGTDGQKMSKSAGNTIELFATDAELRHRIMGIRTDSTPLESPKPIDNALYGLLEIMAPPGEFTQLDASWKAGGKGYADYKKLLLEYFHATFDAARRRREELRRDPAEVERILVDGARRAREIAMPIMEQVRRAAGIR
jgi:tryptophanyl-tRNA synthetase